MRSEKELKQSISNLTDSEAAKIVGGKLSKNEKKILEYVSEGVGAAIAITGISLAVAGQIKHPDKGGCTYYYYNKWHKKAHKSDLIFDDVVPMTPDADAVL